MLRILFFIAVIYFAYRLFNWLPQQLSDTNVCPRCDGKGHWYGVRHREECKACNGSGKIAKRN